MYSTALTDRESSNITGTSPSDLGSYVGRTLGVGVLTPLQRSSRYILQLQPIGQDEVCLIVLYEYKMFGVLGKVLKLFTYFFFFSIHLFSFVGYSRKWMNDGKETGILSSVEAFQESWGRFSFLAPRSPYFQARVDWASQEIAIFVFIYFILCLFYLYFYSFNIIFKNF